LQIAYGNDVSNPDLHTAPGDELMWVAMNVGRSSANSCDTTFSSTTGLRWTPPPQ
jgi:hypothetical protein